MNELRFLADHGGLHERTPWVLLDAARHVLSAGIGVSNAPQANAVLVIVPDERITILSVVLPKLSARQLPLVLPAAVEDQLMTAVENTALVLLEHRPDGVSRVVAWALEWRDGLARTPVLARAKSLRMVAESWGLPLPGGAAALLLTDTRCLLRLPDGSTCVDAHNGESRPPLIALALSQTQPPEHVFCTAEAPAQLPHWVSAWYLKRATQYDWRTASFPSPTSLYQRTHRHFDFAAIRQAFRLPTLIASAWLAFELVAGLINLTSLRYQRESLKERQTETFYEAFGASAVRVDAELQLRRKFAATRAAAGEAVPQDFLALMTRLAQDFPESPSPVLEIRYENSQLILRVPDALAGLAWLKAAQVAGLSAQQETGKDGSSLVRMRP